MISIDEELYKSFLDFYIASLKIVHNPSTDSEIEFVFELADVTNEIKKNKENIKEPKDWWEAVELLMQDKCYDCADIKLENIFSDYEWGKMNEHKTCGNNDCPCMTNFEKEAEVKSSEEKEDISIDSIFENIEGLIKTFDESVENFVNKYKSRIKPIIKNVESILKEDN